VTLRRTKHPAAAAETLRDDRAAVAVTTADQAVRGAWARGTPVRILVAHRSAPAVVLLVSAKHAARVTGVAALRGRRVGMPGPGTTGHLVLLALLARHRLGPADLDLVSFGGTALLTRLASGELAAAVAEEPWASRAIASSAATVLVDLRRPEEAARHLGGPFYEVASLVRADDKRLGELEAPLVAYARALLRVQHWLATTPAEAVAGRLPAGLVGDPERFVARLEAARAGYPPQGHATDAGLRATLEVLRGGSPWPVTLELDPEALREPAFVTAARAALGPAPAGP
jgi:NitT/TauT family transport system substrate-binding protein